MAKQRTTTLFRFEAADLPEIERFFDENMQDPMKAAATHAFADVAALAQKRLRNQVKTRFRDRMTKQSPFEKSFKAWAYPKAPDISMRPAVTVQANPVWAEIFEEGRPKTVRPAVKRFLAIPTEEAEKRGLDKVGAGRGWNRRLSQTADARRIGDTAVVETDKGLFVTAMQGQERLFLFKLVRQIEEPRLLSLMDISKNSLDALPGLFSIALAKTQK